jgi:hypothetical protein
MLGMRLLLVMVVVVVVAAVLELRLVLTCVTGDMGVLI